MPYNTTRLLAWAGNTEADMDHYRIWWGTVTRTYDNFIDTTGLSGLVGSTGRPAQRIAGLLDNTTYFFAVTAWDQAGNQSTFSAEVTRLVTVPLLRILKQNV